MTVTLAVALVGLVAAIVVRFPSDGVLGWHFVLTAHQDLDVAIGFAAAMAIAILVPALPFRLPLPALCAHRAAPWAMAAAGFLLSAAIGAWLIGDYGFSVDEHLLVQEARVFLDGRLAAPVPEEWRPYLYALQPYYVRADSELAVLTTGYFPGSTAIHAAFEVAVGAQLANPILAAGSVVLLARIAKQLFPGGGALAVIAPFTLLISPQFMITAMTPYAMTTHLFLNLLWLTLFLNDNRRSHVAALVVGAAAIVQHQIHLHPLFALPFLADLVLRRRRWCLGSAYFLTYLAVLVACMHWRGLVLGGPAVNLMSGAQEAGGFPALIARIERAFNTSTSIDAATLWATNFVRFSTWQSPLTLVLAGVGIIALRRAPVPLKLAAIGMVLALLPPLLLEPDQGVGWGFRYLHLQLIAVSLLAVWGAMVLRQRSGELCDWLRVRGALIILGGLIAPFLIALRIGDFTAVVLPLKRATESIQTLPADVALTTNPNIVRNDFRFRNPVKVMWLEVMTPDQIALICETKTTVRVGLASSKGQDFIPHNPALSAEDLACAGEPITLNDR